MKREAGHRQSSGQSIKRRPALWQGCFLFVAVLVPLTVVDSFAAIHTEHTDDLKKNLQLYINEVQAIANDVKNAIADDVKNLVDTPNPVLDEYLNHNLGYAFSLQDFLNTNRSDLLAIELLERFNRKRISFKDDRVLPSIPDSFEDSPEFQYLQRENKSWLENLAPFLEHPFVSMNTIRKKLYECKYFEADDHRQANMLEGWLNSTLPLTRYSEGEKSWYRQEGVSAWEASMRVEPLVLVENGNKPGFLLESGLLYNFFPEISQSPDRSFQIQVRDTYVSRHLKRAGLKLGLGTLLNDPETEFLAGAGIQVRAWSFWGVYSTGDSRFSLAASLSDWKWLKKVLPAF